MCRYNIAIDDALMEEVRPHIDRDVAVQAWLKELLRKALLNYAAQFAAPACLITAKQLWSN